MHDPAAASELDALDRSRAERLVDAALGQAPTGLADLFVERSVRAVRGASLGRDAEREHVPLERVDQGAALRAVGPEATRLVHVAGDPGAALERLLDAWKGERASAGMTATGPAASAADVAVGDRGAAAHVPDALLADLRAAARAALARESALAGLDVEVTLASRSTAVMSSRWGFTRGEHAWLLVNVTARARRDGRRGRASRARGGPAAAGPRGLSVEALVAETAEAALARLEARDAGPGRPQVIVAGGAAGVLLHEAVGHALEADVVARGSSFLAARLGETVATPELTVLDDPSIPHLAGSYASDDEGAPAREARLVDRGVLRAVMTDTLRAGFDPAAATGHGRRQGFRDHVLPRMTNTLVVAGPWDPGDLIKTTAKGLLVTRLERASADPLRGRFQVRVTEGFLVESGRVTAPLTETLLVGNSDDLLRALDVGADAAWDDGAGTCGREAQWVGVAIGNPTLRAAEGVFGVA